MYSYLNYACNCHIFNFVIFFFSFLLVLTTKPQIRSDLHKILQFKNHNDAHTVSFFPRFFLHFIAEIKRTKNRDLPKKMK